MIFMNRAGSPGVSLSSTKPGAPRSRPHPAVPTDEESSGLEGSTHDETETDTKATVDEQDQPSAEDDDTAAARTADHPEAPSEKTKTWEAVVQAMTELAEDTVDEDAVPPVALDEAAATGK